MFCFSVRATDWDLCTPRNGQRETTDPRPFDACEDIPIDVINGLGLGFTPPEHED